MLLEIAVEGIIPFISHIENIILLALQQRLRAPCSLHDNVNSL